MTGLAPLSLPQVLGGRAWPALVLVPEDPGLGWDVDVLCDGLRELGLLSSEDGSGFDFFGRQHWRLGARFTALVSFVGCMPFLVLDPAEAMGDQASLAGFMHLSIERFDEPRLLRSSRLRAPSCGHCDGVLKHWEQALAASRCPECGSHLGAADLAWRNDAGFARVFVVIWGVERLEGVPTAGLLQGLERRFGGSPWRYFFRDG